ncbi:MAG: DNA-directed RNA polymerase subunit alpha C-terminal domain-containing protein [Planctomycetota bacterium]
MDQDETAYTTAEAPVELAQPTSHHIQLDIANDPIPNFATLLSARPGVFETTRSFDSFNRRVEALDTTGEEGRRRGLGLWMLGRYADAAEILANYPDDDVATYTCGRSLVSDRRPGEAAPIFESLAKKYPEEPRPRGDMLDAKLDADLATGDVEAAISSVEAVLESENEAFHASAEGRHLRGRVAELSGDYMDALEQFQAARAADPSHRRNLFRLAYLSERVGQEALALDAYETLATMLPVDRAVMINLGVLYEDLGRDQDAAACYDTIARTDPTDRFARLYLEDAKAGISMYYDEDLEKKEDRLNQILRIPITDFELSVRARNCLNKMDIMTLGDLVKKTESELLSYKNFGETSLTEIKEILASKGLRLGMAREEAVASIAKARTVQEGRDLDPNDPRNKSISELKLSIRARRTVENLGCLTLGDITQHREEELLGMPNFGVTSLLELRNRLAEYGLALKGDD